MCYGHLAVVRRITLFRLKVGEEVIGYHKLEKASMITGDETSRTAYMVHVERATRSKGELMNWQDDSGHQLWNYGSIVQSLSKCYHTGFELAAG